MISNKPNIHIIGAGFSGLSLAYLLGKTGRFTVSVFEKNAQVGGMIQSKKEQDCVIESAANSILYTTTTQRFLNEIEADVVHPLPFAKKRYFFRERLRRWPLNIPETLCFAFRLAFHLLTKKKFLKILPHESVETWSVKHFKVSFTKYLLSPALQGIYAASADQLNAESVLGSLFQKKKERILGIVSGLNGMSDLIKSLQTLCFKYKVHIHTETTYNFSENVADIVIVCTSADQAAKLTEEKYPDVAQNLKKISMNNVMSITCFLRKASKKPSGFGCLIPKGSETKCLGILFNSDIFPNRRSSQIETSETYIFSGDEALYLKTLNEIEIKNYMLHIRQVIFKLNDPLFSVHPHFWPSGLPLYNHELHQFQKNLKLPSNLYLHGNYISGIGLSKIISNSYAICETLIKDTK